MPVTPLRSSLLRDTTIKIMYLTLRHINTGAISTRMAASRSIASKLVIIESPYTPMESLATTSTRRSLSKLSKRQIPAISIGLPRVQVQKSGESGNQTSRLVNSDMVMFQTRIIHFIHLNIGSIGAHTISSMISQTASISPLGKATKRLIGITFTGACLEARLRVRKPWPIQRSIIGRYHLTCLRISSRRSMMLL